MLALHVEQGLCNGRVSVCPSVCPIDHAAAAGLLLWARQDISIDSGGRIQDATSARRSAENASNVTLSVDAGS